jgi:hypothetical protein
MPKDTCTHRTLLTGATVLAALALAAPAGHAAAAPASSTVSVSTAAQLVSALASARPGETIKLADGTYTGAFKAAAKGTSSSPGWATRTECVTSRRGSHANGMPPPLINFNLCRRPCMLPDCRLWRSRPREPTERHGSVVKVPLACSGPVARQRAPTGAKCSAGLPTGPRRPLPRPRQSPLGRGRI